MFPLVKYDYLLRYRLSAEIASPLVSNEEGWQFESCKALHSHAAVKNGYRALSENRKRNEFIFL